MALLVVSALGIVGNRVSNMQNSTQDSSSDNQLSEEIINSDNEIDKKEKVSEKLEASAESPSVVNEEPETSTESSSEVSSSGSGASSFQFTKGGGSLQGDYVSVSQTSTDAHTGTCTFNFSLGNSKVTRSNKITNSRTCSIDIPASSYPKNGIWYFSLAFSSTDGSVAGTGGGFNISVNPKPTEVGFVKGGLNADDDSVNVSLSMPSAYTGQCVYSFNLNGVERINERNNISNSKTCSIEVAKSRFPKSATYQVYVSFVSTNQKTKATSSELEVSVK
jgi:hypothetical protein